MTNFWTLVIACGFGSTAFGVIFRVKPKHLFFIFIGGMLTTSMLLICLSYFDGNNLVANMVSSFFGTLYCILCAHWRKAPFTVFIVPSLFPLVPGKALYYTMVGFFEHDKSVFIENIVNATEIALGIAIGIMIGNIFNTIIKNRTRKVVDGIGRLNKKR
ncbi:MAG: threonine/serine exporter family protein [Candidatus Limimorpha sp.]